MSIWENALTLFHSIGIKSSSPLELIHTNL